MPVYDEKYIKAKVKEFNGVVNHSVHWHQPHFLSNPPPPPLTPANCPSLSFLGNLSTSLFSKM